MVYQAIVSFFVGLNKHTSLLCCRINYNCNYFCDGVPRQFFAGIDLLIKIWGFRIFNCSELTNLKVSWSELGNNKYN
jgi:hypothetical protein